MFTWYLYGFAKMWWFILDNQLFYRSTGKKCFSESITLSIVLHYYIMDIE